ncbi:MAG TPA: OsmC family protein [Anaerolineales bacterium]|jgi:osmotically inducible protein OsmC
MAIRTAQAVWEGTLREGKGKLLFGQGDHKYEGPYGFASRFEEGDGTNPEELIGAAHAGCFSMALSGALGRAGHPPTSIRTQADVHLERVNEAWTITRVKLTTTGIVDGLDQAAFEEHAMGAKANCPVSRALTGVEIQVEARLEG